MALKLYGVNSSWDLPFMIRARGRGVIQDSPLVSVGAQRVTELFEAQLGAISGPLAPSDFNPPIRLTGPLVAEGFLSNGPVNGGSV